MSEFGAWVAVGSVGVAVALAGLLLRNRRRLRIDERGILAPGLRLGTIRWDEIKGAYHPGARDDQCVRLVLRVSDRLARRLPQPPAGRTLDVRLDLAGTGVSPLQLVHEIVSRAAHPAA